MMKTTVDLFVSAELRADAALLTTRIGAKDAWKSLPGRDLWTLKGDKIEQMVALTVEQEVEEFYYPSLGLSARAAKKLKVRPGRRYTLTFHEATRTISFKRSPVSSGVFPIVVQSGIPNGVLIAGVRIHSELGMPLLQIPLDCRKNTAKLNLKVKVSPNLGDTEALAVNEETAKRLGLAGRRRYKIQYNQETKILIIGAI